MISNYPITHLSNRTMTPLQQSATRYADEIEAEMKRIGMWQPAPLQPQQLKFKQAFAMDTMTFSQWLQFVFLSRLREAIASNDFPSESNVGVQAVREFDGQPDADHLLTLLSEFDALFSKYE